MDDLSEDRGECRRLQWGAPCHTTHLGVGSDFFSLTRHRVCPAGGSGLYHTLDSSLSTDYRVLSGSAGVGSTPSEDADAESPAAFRAA